MRAKMLLNLFLFIFVFCCFFIPNEVKAADLGRVLQNTCEYTHVTTGGVDDYATKTSRFSINMYSESETSTTLSYMDANIFSLYDEEYDGKKRYEVKNWKQDKGFYFTFYQRDYYLDTDDRFKNVDTFVDYDPDYIGRTISFQAYVNDVNNYDFSICPQYVYVANVGGGDINVFISRTAYDSNSYLYSDLFTRMTYSFEEHDSWGVDTQADKNRVIHDLLSEGSTEDVATCPFGGEIIYNPGETPHTADMNFCIFNPFVEGGTVNKTMYDGTYYNYVADYATAANVTNHYDEVQSSIANRIAFGGPVFCENLFIMEEGSVGWILQRILNYIKIFGPIAVILLSAIDFIKAIMSSDEKIMQSVQSKFIIRLIAAIALFLIPLIVQLILNVFLGISNPTCGIQ